MVRAAACVFFFAAMALMTAPQCASAQDGFWTEDAFGIKPSGKPDHADMRHVRVRLLERVVDLNADGSFTSRIRSEVEVLSQAAVGALGQRVMTYSDHNQTIAITEAYTLKPDGTKLMVRPDAIITRAKSSANSHHSFGDMMEKVILFPNVEVGDVLASETRYETKPRFAGHFSFTLTFPGSVVVDSDRTVISAPKSLPLYTDIVGARLETRHKDGRVIHTVEYRNPHTEEHEGDYLSNFNRGPHVYVSSFADYAAFANVYAQMVKGKDEVTPEIRARAEKIVAGATDRRDQARLIYEWVAAHIRYVALGFGIGSVVPHDAASVLRDGYGDCKDHAVLFSALLKARGIESHLVLIHSAPIYALSKYPTPAEFNHVISYLPEFGLYADTTPRDQPFGTLQFFEYGKQVVRIGFKRDAVATIPPLRKADSAFTSTSSMKIDADGVLTGEQITTTRGPIAAGIRRLGARLSSSPTKAAESLLKIHHLAEGKGVLHFPQGVDLALPYVHTGAFTVEKQQRMLSGKSFVLPKGLSLIDLKSGNLLGPFAMPQYNKADPVACFSGSAGETIELEFPAGKKPAELPADVKIEQGGIRYASHWSLVGNRIKVHREIEAEFPKPLCAGAQLEAARAALEKIREDYRTEISLVDGKDEKDAEKGAE